ncbi:hypothetical protein AB2G49_26795 (plasmid) [Escherichia coli]
MVAVVPVDYLLGRERNREGATVLSGESGRGPGTHRCHAICVKKYTSGEFCRSRRKAAALEGVKRVMASFERVLMPGLEKNQYSILWVEHQDKGRLELNFVVPEHGAADRKTPPAVLRPGRQAES